MSYPRIISLTAAAVLCAASAMAQPVERPRAVDAPMPRPEIRPGFAAQQEIVAGIAHYPDEIIEAILNVASKPALLNEQEFESDEDYTQARLQLQEHPEILRILRDHEQTTRMTGRMAARNIQRTWELIDQARVATSASGKQTALPAAREQIVTSTAAIEEQQRAMEETQQATVVMDTPTATVTREPIEEGTETSAMIAEMKVEQQKEVDTAREESGIVMQQQPARSDASSTTSTQRRWQVEPQSPIESFGRPVPSVNTVSLASMTEEEADELIREAAQKHREHWDKVKESVENFRRQRPQDRQ